MLAALVLPGLLLLSSAAVAASEDAALRPNVVVFLTDDQGWTGTSVPMDPDLADSASDFYETPSLELLAAGGTRFSYGYAPGPNCAPSRASIETGRSPAQLGITDNHPAAALPAGVETIARILHAEAPDYVTGHFGKWHLNGGGPGAHGYDEHDDGDVDPPPHDPEPNPKDMLGLTDRAEAFIDARVAAGEPFFLMLSHHAVHVPEEARPATKATYAAKPAGTNHSNVDYAAMTDDLDAMLGRILEKLALHGILDETYLVYTGDNGAREDEGLTANVPLRGGKTRLFEGGVRVPFVFAGPGIRAGRVDDEVAVIGWDLLPTLLAWLGLSHAVPEGVEGRNLRPLLEGHAGSVPCSASARLAWHFPHWRVTREIEPHSSVLVDACGSVWKAIRFYETEWQTEELQLYELESDPGETDDLAAAHPALAELMQGVLSAYLASVGAPCPNEDPELGPICPRPRSGRCGLGAEAALVLLALAGARRWRMRRTGGARGHRA